MHDSLCLLPTASFDVCAVWNRGVIATVEDRFSLRSFQWRIGSLYEDSGEGYHYRDEKGSVLKQLKLEKTENGMTLSQSRVGEFTPEDSEYHLMIHGADLEATQISIDGGDVFQIKPGEVVKLPESFVAAHLS